MKNFIKIAAVLFAAFFLLLVSLKFYAASQWPSRSEVAPLVLPDPPTPKELAAWQTLRKAIDLSPDDVTDIMPERIYRGNYKKQDTTKWTHFDEALRTLEELRTVQEMQSPLPPMDMDIVSPSVFNYSYLLRANDMRSWELLKKGETEKALDYVNLSLHVSKLLRHAEGELIASSLGTAQSMFHLTILEEIMEVHAWESVEGYRKILEILQSNDEDYIAAITGLKYEAMAADKMLQHPNRRSDGSDSSSPIFALTYDSDATRAASLLLWKEVLQHVSLSYVERKKTTRPSEKTPPYMEGLSGTFHNQQGAVLISIAFPNYSALIAREELLHAQRRVLLTLCAARLYMWENNGEMPQKIEDLVPKYLTKPPKDPFSEGPIRLKEGVISSIYHDEPASTFLYQDSDKGPFLYRTIAIPNAAKPIDPKRRGKKRRRRR